MLTLIFSLIVFCASFSHSLPLDKDDLDKTMASRHSDFRYWKCESGEWVKKYNPSYEKPKLSCPEIEKAQKEVVDANRCPDFAPGQNCSELCLVAGGEYINNRCVGRIQDQIQPCSDSGECASHCVLDISANSTEYRYEVPRESYFLGPGTCWGHLGSAVGGYCSAKGGYFSSCGFFD